MRFNETLKVLILGPSGLPIDNLAQITIMNLSYLNFYYDLSPIRFQSPGSCRGPIELAPPV